MGKFAIGMGTKIFSWIIASIIVVLNAKMVMDEIQGWMQESSHPWILRVTVVPIALGALVLLLFITFRPLVKRDEDYYE